MLPYVELPTLGPINSFGILALLGVFFGTRVAYHQAERLGLDLASVRGIALCAAVFGLLGAHLVDVLLYQPGWSGRDGAIWTLLNPFAGISSYGGLVGASLGFVLFAHRTGIRKIRYADVTALGLLVLMTFGRAGCASVHDHIGVASSSMLAVDVPAQGAKGVVGPHHDLGLYELLLLLALLSVVVLLLRRPRRAGWLAAFIMVSYAVPRFFLDFLRRETTDPRYLDLTPAQWISIAVSVTGVALFAWIHSRGEPARAGYLPATPWWRSGFRAGQRS